MILHAASDGLHTAYTRPTHDHLCMIVHAASDGLHTMMIVRPRHDEHKTSAADDSVCVR